MISINAISLDDLKVEEPILINQDCLQAMTNLPDNSIDAVITDLPYGMTHCKWDKKVSLEEMWEHYKRIIKKNGVIISTSKQPFTTDLINSNRDWFRYSLVWLKSHPTGYLNAKRMPLQSHEDIVVFYKSLPTYNPQMLDGFERKAASAESKKKCVASTVYGKALNFRDYDSTSRYPISVVYFASDTQKSALHQTQKPVELFKWIINSYTNPGDIVLDSFMGSGTTGVACLQTGRKFIGMEIDKDIFEIAKGRIYESKYIYTKENKCGISK